MSGPRNVARGGRVGVRPAGAVVTALLAVAFAVALWPGHPAGAVPVAEPTPGGQVSIRVGVSIGPKPGGSPSPTGSPSPSGQPSPTTEPSPSGATTTTPTSPPAGGGSLPRTGVALGGLLLVGGALVAGGVALRWSARRRATAEAWLSRTGG
ncbi:hypothetical protein [Micromonospora sp. NPDC006431]|uniref:hypothetical protein n=1 Tax=Micromonospora sp. NPDC006431 TaxID=3364235 RepID=UPI0036AAD71B